MNAPYPALAASTANPARDDRPRYAQLLYTSYDDGSGVGGGWQVKDQRGGLTAAERDELTARVVTRFEVEPALPQFPTPDQIANRPARLAYGSLSGGATAYWHTVDAGNDATGRPGNVMAHVLLDRDPARESALRPIQLWESADWRRPYGPAEVRATTLPAGLELTPNPAITASAAIHFLTGTQVDRQGVFRVLLDAVHAALSEGPKVVLVVDDPTSGPKWIAAVSYFMSPGTARRLNWCTPDTAALAAADVRRGTELVVVPRNAAAQLPPGDWIVIDENDEPTVRELGASHSAGGALVTVTPWSTLTEGVLADETLAPRILARQDEVAAEVGDHGLAPSWPLAVAVYGEPELAEFGGDAQRAIADDAPAHVARVGRLSDVVAEASIATAPHNAAEALERLTGAARRGAGRRAAEQFLRVALADPTHLDELTLTDVPAVRCLDRQGWQPMLDAAVTTTLDRDPGGHAARRLIRIAELLERLVEPDAGDPHLAVITPLVRIAGLQCLWGPDPTVLTSQTDVSARVREIVVRGALVDASPAELTGIVPPTWRWLFADEHAPAADIAEPAPNPGPADRALYPRYVRALISTGAPDLTPERSSVIAGHAVLSAVEAAQIPDEECRLLVAQLADTARLDEREVLDVLTTWPRRVPPAIAVTSVLYLSVHPDMLETVAMQPLDDTGPIADSIAVAAARLRLLASPGPPRSVAQVEGVISQSAPILFAHLPVEHVGRIVPELAAGLAGASVAAQCAQLDWVDPAAPVARALRRRLHGSDGAEATNFIVDLAKAGLVDAGWVVAQAFLGRVDPRLPMTSVMGSTNRGRDQGAEWADRVVSRLIDTGSYSGPRDAAALRDAAWPIVRTLTAAEAEAFFARYEKTAREWLRDHRF